MGQLELLVATDTIQRYLQDLAKLKGAADCSGPNLIKFIVFSIPRYEFENSKFHYGLITDGVINWINTDQASWIVENIANIIVDGHIDGVFDVVRIMIYARVNDSMSTEYLLKWSD